MDYNWDLSITNLHNVVATLNKGGLFSIREIAEDLWEEAPDWKRVEKIEAARDVRNRNTQYAKKQVIQEVRRTIHEYFNSESWYEICRVDPLGCPEQFYVMEIQTQEPSAHEGDLVDVIEELDVDSSDDLNAVEDGYYLVRVHNGSIQWNTRELD